MCESLMDGLVYAARGVHGGGERERSEFCKGDTDGVM